jgi:hypothetical protein
MGTDVAGGKMTTDDCAINVWGAEWDGRWVRGVLEFDTNEGGLGCCEHWRRNGDAIWLADLETGEHYKCLIHAILYEQQDDDEYHVELLTDTLVADLMEPF